MIGIDTNVLVRYIAQDDPVQSKRATQLVEQVCSEATPGSNGFKRPAWLAGTNIDSIKLMVMSTKIGGVLNNRRC